MVILLELNSTTKQLNCTKDLFTGRINHDIKKSTFVHILLIILYDVTIILLLSEICIKKILLYKCRKKMCILRLAI